MGILSEENIKSLNKIKGIARYNEGNPTILKVIPFYWEEVRAGVKGNWKLVYKKESNKYPGKVDKNYNPRDYLFIYEDEQTERLLINIRTNYRYEEEAEPYYYYSKWDGRYGKGYKFKKDYYFVGAKTKKKLSYSYGKPRLRNGIWEITKPLLSLNAVAYHEVAEKEYKKKEKMLEKDRQRSLKLEMERKERELEEKQERLAREEEERKRKEQIRKEREEKERLLLERHKKTGIPLEVLRNIGEDKYIQISPEFRKYPGGVYNQRENGYCIGKEAKETKKSKSWNRKDALYYVVNITKVVYEDGYYYVYTDLEDREGFPYPPIKMKYLSNILCNIRIDGKKPQGLKRKNRKELIKIVKSYPVRMSLDYKDEFHRWWPLKDKGAYIIRKNGSRCWKYDKKGLYKGGE